MRRPESPIFCVSLPNACAALPLTQEQLADATGLTPVHVNRVFHSLRASGVVQLERRSVTIRNWPRLAAMADFDPAYLKREAPAV